MADSPTHSPQSSAGQSTRQLLDELDALMQRMLAVPVQPGDSAPPAEAAIPVQVAPRSVELVPAPIAAMPAQGTRSRPPETVPNQPEPSVSGPLMPIILKRPQAAGAEMPAVPRVQAPVLPAMPSSAPQSQTAPNAKPAWMNPNATRSAPAPVSPGWGTNLVVALNRSYDRTTDWLGPLGRWLRGEQGRSLLGWTGLAMFVLAIVWAALRFLG